MHLSDNIQCLSPCICYLHCMFQMSGSWQGPGQFCPLSGQPAHPQWAVETETAALCQGNDTHHSPILNRIWVIHSPICHNRFLRLEYPNALLLSPSFFYRTCNIRLKLETKLENYFLKHSYHGIITFLARVLQNKHAIFVFTATLMNSTHVEA